MQIMIVALISVFKKNCRGFRWVPNPLPKSQRARIQTHENHKSRSSHIQEVANVQDLVRPIELTNQFGWTDWHHRKCQPSDQTFGQSELIELLQFNRLGHVRRLPFFLQCPSVLLDLFRLSDRYLYIQLQNVMQQRFRYFGFFYTFRIFIIKRAAERPL